MLSTVVGPKNRDLFDLNRLDERWHQVKLDSPVRRFEPDYPPQVTHADACAVHLRLLLALEHEFGSRSSILTPFLDEIKMSIDVVFEHNEGFARNDDYADVTIKASPPEQLARLLEQLEDLIEALALEGE